MPKTILASLLWLLILNSCHHTLPPPPVIESVRIGNQKWMLKNLDVDTYSDGTKIPEVQSDSAWIRYGNDKMGCWCYYNDSEKYGKVYGKLYNWYAVHNEKGLAPVGWHIPKGDEWDTLITALGGTPGMDSVAGAKLKSINGWQNRDDGTSGNGSDTSGFHGLPAGGRYFESNLNSFGVGYYSNFWAFDTVPNDPRAKDYTMHWNNNGVNRAPFSKGDCFSVRCIKDR